MVSRKSSLPYPTSPPPPPPTDFNSIRPNHDVVSDDVPPIPQTPARDNQDSPYHDMGNPWQEVPSASAPKPSESRTAISKGSSLQQSAVLVERPQIPTEQQQLPDILKAGWSGEHTPRSSIDSDRSKEFWESSDDEEPENPQAAENKVLEVKNKTPSPSHIQELPPSLQVRRKPVSPVLVAKQTQSDANHDFASNNPFRPQNAEGGLTGTDDWVEGYNAKGKARATSPMSRPLNTSTGSALQQGETELGDSPWEEVVRAHQPQPQVIPPPIPAQAPPPVPGQVPFFIPQPHSPFNEQPPLIAVNPPDDNIVDPWKPIAQAPTPSRSPLPQQEALYSNDLLNRDPKAAEPAGKLSLGDELRGLPNHAPGAKSHESLSLLDDGEDPLMAPMTIPEPSRSQQTDNEQQSKPNDQPQLLHAESPMRGNDLPPVKPPRPAIVTKVPTEAELEEMNSQRNETYQIKHFRWFDHRTRKMRSSSMLTQNKNGPCPLLALVNALILGASDQDQAALDEFLRTREQVTLGTIIENLMMELLSSAEDGELPDVDELNRFLLKLRTGMNMNPRFVTPPAPAPNLMDVRNSMLHLPQEQQQHDTPGTFEPSQDIQLYSAFGVQTVHGWLAEPGSEAAAAFTRSAHNYEDAQAKLFGEDELEYKLSRNGLTPEEQVVWEDIISMKYFFQTNPTQLTQYGLDCIKSSVNPGSFTVLFRNDHFSTIYKNPNDGKLYSLITDAGYADRDEIVWESLVDISGQQSEFFSGDFKSVSHTGESSSGANTARRASDRQNYIHNNQDSQTQLSTSQKQEQEDADLAMAMMLQQEEEERDRERRNPLNPTPPGQQPNRPASGRRSTGNIPIPIRSSNTNVSTTSVPEVRPIAPPRTSRTSNPAVNRPTNPTDTDTPPSYEEAARGKAYHPPLGSPLHPTSSASLVGEGSTLPSTSNINTSDSGTPSNRNRTSRRRSSAYMENSERFSTINSSTTTGPGTGIGPTTGPGRGQSQGPSPAYDLHEATMPGSYIHTGRGGHGASVNHSNNYPYQNAGSGTGSGTGTGAASGYGYGYNNYATRQHQHRDRDRDCIVM